MRALERTGGRRPAHRRAIPRPGRARRQRAPRRHRHRGGDPPDRRAPTSRRGARGPRRAWAPRRSGSRPHAPRPRRRTRPRRWRRVGQHDRRVVRRRVGVEPAPKRRRFGLTRGGRARRYEEDTSESTSLLQQVAAATDEAFGARRATEARSGLLLLLQAQRDRAEEDVRVAERSWRDLAGDGPRRGRRARRAALRPAAPGRPVRWRRTPRGARRGHARRSGDPAVGGDVAQHRLTPPPTVEDDAWVDADGRPADAPGGAGGRRGRR